MQKTDKVATCPGCSESYWDQSPSTNDHNPMTIFYTCPECHEEWFDDWCSAVDSECPSCGASDIQPVKWRLWEPTGPKS